jgi:hypothetical protein
MKLSYLNIIIIFTLVANTVPIIGGEKEKILTPPTTTPEVTVRLTLAEIIKKTPTQSDNSFLQAQAAFIVLNRGGYTDLDIPEPETTPIYQITKAMVNGTNWIEEYPKNIPNVAASHESLEYQTLFPKILCSDFVEKIKNNGNRLTITTTQLKTPINLILELEKVIATKETVPSAGTKKYFFYGVTALGLIGFIIWLTNMHKNIPTLFALKTTT